MNGSTLKSLAALLTAWLQLSACDSGGQAAAKSMALSYNSSSPFPAVVGEAIALTPAISGPADHFAVTPTLPPDLSLNELNGVISGVPRRASAPVTFTITASRAGTRATFPLVLSVIEPPSGLSYSSPVLATVGVPLTPLSPRIAGIVDHYAISPALPRGLAFDDASGLVSGTPGVATSLAPYTITASSLAGRAAFVLLLTVNPAPATASTGHVESNSP